MTTKKKWVARAGVLGLIAAMITGVSAGSASALGSTCTPGGQRPSGPLVNLLSPLLGDPGYPRTPLGDSWVPVVGTVDAVVCQVLP